MKGPPKKDRIPLKKGMWSAPDPDSSHLFAEHRLTAGQMTTTLAQHWPGIARRAVSIPWLVDLDAVIRHNDGIQRRPGYTWANAGSMLGQRHRRWPSIEPALDHGGGVIQNSWITCRYSSIRDLFKLLLSAARPTSITALSLMWTHVWGFSSGQKVLQKTKWAPLGAAIVCGARCRW